MFRLWYIRIAAEGGSFFLERYFVVFCVFVCSQLPGTFRGIMCIFYMHVRAFPSFLALISSYAPRFAETVEAFVWGAGSCHVVTRVVLSKLFSAELGKTKLGVVSFIQGKQCTYTRSTKRLASAGGADRTIRV